MLLKTEKCVLEMSKHLRNTLFDVKLLQQFEIVEICSETDQTC